MYVLFLNVKRRGTPWLTNYLTDCPVGTRVVVMVQWFAHPPSNQGDAGSISTHDNMFFIQMDQLVVRCRYLYTQIT